MTTPVCVRRRIRQLDRQGLSHREISRKLGVSRTTVVKYANHGDCSPKPRLGACGQVAGRRGVFGRRGRVAGRGSAHARQAAPHRDARVRAARGGVRVHGLVFVGAALGQALEAGASRGVGRLRRVGVGAGQRAGRFRPGPGRGRRSRTRVHFLVVSFPYSNVRWVVALPGETSGACARVCCGSSSAWAWRLGWWCSTTPPGSATAGRTARPPGPACSPCSARITGSGRGSATRIPATGRAVWRTPSASSGAT